MNCGNCKEQHELAVQVKACYGNSGRFDTTVDLPEVDPVEDEMAAEELAAERAATVTAETDDRYAAEADLESARAVPTGPINWGLGASGNGVQTGSIPRQGGYNPNGEPATTAQLSFIRRLGAERDTTNLGGIDLERHLDVGGGKTITKREASRLIDSLQKLPRKATNQTPTEDLEDGFYEKDGTVYKIVHAVHGSGKQYAKELNVGTGKFEYAGRSPLHKLTADDRLTLERAKELGHLYGMCCICGATLTNETSIEAGIGPVCATKV